jgi:hypothetical protein
MGGLGSGGPGRGGGRSWACRCGAKNRPMFSACQGCGTARAASAQGAARVLAHPSVPAAPVESVELNETQAPNDLTVDERLVWMELARIALGRGKTLAESKPTRSDCSVRTWRSSSGIPDL